jgi:MFS family permease
MNPASPSLKNHLQALPRTVWLLFFGTFLNKFGTFVLPFLTIYLTRRGFSKAETGLALAAYGVGLLLAAVVGGYLADTLGRRKTIVLSMFSVAAAMLCLSQARQLGVIVAFTWLAGFTGEMYRPASTALLADLVPSEHRITAFAAYRLSFNAGWMFGPAIGGLMAKHSFLDLFIGDALTSLLYGCLAWFALPEGHRPVTSSSSLRQTWQVIRRDRRFIQILSAALAVGLVFVQIFSSFSMHLASHGYSESAYGIVLSLNGALVVLLELPLTMITRRYPARKVMALGFLLVGLGFASCALGGSVALVLFTMGLLTLGEMIAMPVSGAYVADLAPPHLRGQYLGAYGLVWAVALVCGPSLGLILYGASPACLWLSCGLLGGIAAVTIGSHWPERTAVNPKASIPPTAAESRLLTS